MLPNKKAFNIETSLNRINEILSPSRSIIAVDSSYDIEKLDYYDILEADLIYISILLRTETKMIPEAVLLKQYKTCLSELIPLLAEKNSLVDVDVMQFLNVMGIYSYKKDESLDGIIDIVAKLNSMCEVLNLQFDKHNMTRMTPGIGVTIAKTHILRMTEAKPKTEEIHRVSDGIRDSLEYSRIANTGLVKNPIIVSSSIWERLTEKYKQFFSYNETAGYYYASLINTSINNWLNENR